VGALSKFEGGVEDVFDRAAGAVFRGPIQPAQIAKRAEKQMLREKLVGSGKQHAPTLYTVLVNPDDDRKLFGFYPTLSSEVETYLLGKGNEKGLRFDGRPLVRFIVDNKLKSGKIDVIAEVVAAPIVEKLRQEELEYYGIAPKQPANVSPEAARQGNYPAGNVGDRPAARDGFDVPADIDLPAPGAAGAVGAVGVAGAAGAAGAVGAVGVAGVASPSPEAAGLRADLHRQHRDSGKLRDNIAVPDPADSIDSLHAGALVAGIDAASAMGSARLVNMSAGKTYALTRTEMTLGRDPACEIVIGDANATRRHALLSQDVVGSWKLTDLGSTNGTLLNDKPINKALLRDGDEITIGVTILAFKES
jgi:hypothetical protein